MSLTVDPKEALHTANGGSVFINVTSALPTRAAFKVKISNIDNYRVKPVYGFLDPKASVKIEILRFIAPVGKEEKLVVQWAEVPAEEGDPTASFKAGAECGEVPVPLKTA